MTGRAGAAAHDDDRARGQEIERAITEPPAGCAGSVAESTRGGTATSVELADAVEAVRDQLVDAASRATGSRVVFEVGPIEMEFAVELRRDAARGAKVRAWVLEAGADTTRSTALTHRVAVTLTPRAAGTGDPWLVGNDDQGDVSHFGHP